MAHRSWQSNMEKKKQNITGDPVDQDHGGSSVTVPPVIG